MKLRRVTMEDARMLWEWANDAETRKNSFSAEPIPWEEHLAWMKRRMADAECLFLVLEDGAGTACGTIRYDLVAGDAIRISYSVAPTERGKGYGTMLLELGEAEARAFFGKKKLVAEVKPENEYSRRCFKRCGYTLSAENAQELKFEKCM